MQSANPQRTCARMCGWVSELQLFNKSANFDQTAHAHHITVDSQNTVLFTYLHIQYQHGGRTNLVLWSQHARRLTYILEI
jgi:hypothetical protein